MLKPQTGELADIEKKLMFKKKKASLISRIFIIPAVFNNAIDLLSNILQTKKMDTSIKTVLLTSYYTLTIT